MVSSESTRAIRLSGLERIILDHTGNIRKRSAERAFHSDARKELVIEPSWTCKREGTKISHVEVVR